MYFKKIKFGETETIYEQIQQNKIFYLNWRFQINIFKVKYLYCIFWNSFSILKLLKILEPKHFPFPYTRRILSRANAVLCLTFDSSAKINTDMLLIIPLFSLLNLNEKFSATMNESVSCTALLRILSPIAFQWVFVFDTVPLKSMGAGWIPLSLTHFVNAWVTHHAARELRLSARIVRTEANIALLICS